MIDDEKGKENQRIAPSDSPVDNRFIVTDDSITNCNTGEVLLQSPLPELENRFQPKKAASVYLSQVYTYLGMQARADSVHGCGDYLEFAVTADSCKLHRAFFCKDRLCPMCNWRRSLKTFSQVSKVMDFLQLSGNYDFLFLTLTVRNCCAAELPATVSALYDGWRQMYHENKRFKKACKGTFRTLEITYNEREKTYHPHLHCILAVPADYCKNPHLYISQRDWSQIWQSCCALDYVPIVDIRRVRRSDARPGCIDLAGAVAEVAKYATKGSSWGTGDLEHDSSIVRSFVSSLSRRRLVDMTGCFRKAAKALSLDDVENGDLTHLDPDSVRDDLGMMIVRFAWKSGCYTQVSD